MLQKVLNFKIETQIALQGYIQQYISTDIKKHAIINKKISNTIY